MTEGEMILLIGSVWESCGGRPLSDGAMRMIVDDLMVYPEHAVVTALDRCRREVRGRMSLADIIQRIDDGHLDPDAAWALCPRGEYETVVWTLQIARAWTDTRRLQLDPVAHRQAFREIYRRELETARMNREPAVWSVSLGQDARQRDAVLLDAVERGRITESRARSLAPNLHLPSDSEQKALPDNRGPESIAKIVEGWKDAE